MRVQTSNYAAETATQFQWATTDNDLFDREYDLYRLAQALEKHTHNPNTGRGLPVEQLAGGAITSGAYAPNSIPNSAYLDGSIYGGKIAAGGITDDRMQYPPLHKAGDTTTGDLRLTRTALGDNAGAYLFWGPSPSNAYLHWNGTHFALYNPNAGGVFYITADVAVLRPGKPAEGYTFYGSGGYIGMNPSGVMVCSGSPIVTLNNLGTYTVGVPLYGQIHVPTAAQIPGDGRWVRVPGAEGRLMANAGTINNGTGIVLGENSGPTNLDWTLTAHLSVSHNLTTGAGGGNTGPMTGAPFLAAAASSNNATGATNVSVGDHVHPVSGSGGAVSGTITLNNVNQRVYPPYYSAVMIQRNS